MIKVVTLVGTRPEIIKLSETIKKFEIFFNHTLIHSGQHYDYELSDIFFKDLGLKKPSIYLNSAKRNAVETICSVINNFYKILKKLKPDAVIVLGDTNSAMGVFAAKKLKIPIFHLEAGNRCFNLNNPEELNRKLIDQMSDINMPYTSIARSYLIKDGLDPDKIIKVGSPMNEVLSKNDLNFKKSNTLKKFNLKKNNYFLVSFHREENILNKKKIEHFINLLNYLSKDLKTKVIVSTHFRTHQILKKKNYFNKMVELHKPFGFIDYINLQKNSRLVLSDSGSLTEEASILGFKAIDLRDENERPEGMEEGTVTLTGLDLQKIKTAHRYLLNKNEKNKSQKIIVADYQSKNFSDKVLNTIISYIDYINRKNWSKF
jgi:UDP-N-acetylglucosamine 2-epimerase